MIATTAQSHFGHIAHQYLDLAQARVAHPCFQQAALALVGTLGREIGIIHGLSGNPSFFDVPCKALVATMFIRCFYAPVPFMSPILTLFSALCKAVEWQVLYYVGFSRRIGQRSHENRRPYDVAQ
jgi:hypothetical protein